jgi:hypothetical protein
VQQWLGTDEGDTIRVGDREAVGFKLYGSIPHTLNAVYGGSSIESARAYLAKFPVVPLNLLVGFEGRELDVCRDAAAQFGASFAAPRIDRQ